MSQKYGFLVAYKPFWMFWHPGSGAIGGLIAGTVFNVVVGGIIWLVAIHS